MYRKHDKKMIIIDILDILRRHSDVNHRLKQDDILEYLKNEYLMDVDRRAVSDNLERLIAEDDYDINYDENARGTGKNKNVIKTNFYINHDFDDNELRLLIDGLLFSKYIPYSQCKELIKKLCNLSSEHFLSRVKYVKTLPDTMKRNAELFTTIEIVDEAISKNKKISFNYCSYDIDKKLIPHKDADGKIITYEVTPYYMVATNSRYYLICNKTGKDDLGIYIVDRIINASISNVPAEPKEKVKGLKNGETLPSHVMEHLYMTLGDSAVVNFEFDKSILSDVIDWFGKDIILKVKDENTFVGSTRVNLKAMKFWAMQFSEGVKITSPKSLVEEMRRLANNVANKYKA